MSRQVKTLKPGLALPDGHVYPNINTTVTLTDIQFAKVSPESFTNGFLEDLGGVPDGGYLTPTEGDGRYVQPSALGDYATDVEAAAAASSAVSAHEAAGDPHPVYLSQAEGDATFANISSASLAAAPMLARMKRGWEDVTVLLVGDSTGNSSGEWFYLVQQKMATDWPTHTFKHYFWNDTTNVYDAAITVATGSGLRTVHFYNASVPGIRMDYLLGSKFGTAVRAVAPDLIFTSYGHNDGSTDTVGAKVAARERILSLSETMALTCPHASIIILTQNVRTDVSGETWGVRASRYDKAAEQAGRGFIDVHQVFSDTGDPAAYLLSDGVHPATATDLGKLNGSDLWASTVYKQLQYNKAISPRAAQPSSFTLPVTNLVANGDFSSFTSPPALPNWTVSNATLSKDTTNFEAPHGYAVRMASTAAGAASMYQDLPVAQYKGRWVTCAARVFIPEGQVGTAGRIGIEDGVLAVTSIGNASARGGFFWIVQSKQIASTATFARIRTYAGSAAGVSYDLTVDRVVLVAGLLPRDIR